MLIIVNLKITSISNLILFFLIVVFLFLSKASSSSENKIIFKINDIAFTSLDLEKRLGYLDFVGSNDNIDKNIVIQDFISASLFHEYYKKLDTKYNYEQEINEIYENILNNNIKNNKKYEYTLNKNSIINNIKIDYVRKVILENILNSSKNDLKLPQEEIDLLYNIKIKYINIISNNFKELKSIINNFENINFEIILNFLKNNNIDYFSKEKEINNINEIDIRIKENILSNNKFFLIEKENFISLIFIEKNFETFQGTIVKLYSVRSNIELKEDYLKCKNLNNLSTNENIISKEYQMTDLNNELKKSLININDYVKYVNNNENVYIVLCDIRFDEDIINNFNFSKIINLNITEIENKFINKYSKIYNLIKFDE